MSSLTWTQDELRSDLTFLEMSAWRLVEAQHIVSTLKLVSSLHEQTILEDILEESKPLLPPECSGFDYLLSTPFRYRPYPEGSRFRRAGLTPGVWYGAQSPETAVAEMAFYRVLSFYAESPDTPFPEVPAVFTAISVTVRSEMALDLVSGRLSHASHTWMHVTDYRKCQDLADDVRAVGGQVIRYTSVRDPKMGANVAVLTPRAFKTSSPDPVRQTWHLKINSSGVLAVCEYPRNDLDFSKDHFGHDPRLRDMNWDRG